LALFAAANKEGIVTMKYVYPACFYEESEGYSVLFADFECATQGGSLAEAIEMAAEAAAGWIMGSIEKGEPLPAASAPESVRTDGDGFVSLVYIDLDEYKAVYDAKPVKKTLTIPSWLNQAAERSSINFSAVLRDALMEKLAR
jgi:predicted RNase H-like HicB family nuclease